MAGSAPPLIPRLLGYAGLLPQIAVVVLTFAGGPAIRDAALLAGLAFAALILSFLGGLWWGFAARFATTVPTWIWVAAVAPSLLAFAVSLALIIDTASVRSAMGVIGAGLLVSLIVDARLTRADMAPAWWMRLRIPLSCGLGLLTILAAIV